MTYQDIKKKFTDHGYPFYTKPYDLNLYGIRNESNEVDLFNDILGLAFVDHFGNEINLQHWGTTKPGLYYLKNKLGNPEGTAILHPGHYKACWKLGLHNGKYEALIQSERAKFEVWRDFNSDGKLDYTGKLFTDVAGLNMHTESLISVTEKVGAYSAGCQVRKNDFEHFAVINLCKMQIQEGNGNYFSYSLF